MTQRAYTPLSVRWWQHAGLQRRQTMQIQPCAIAKEGPEERQWTYRMNVEEPEAARTLRRCEGARLAVRGWRNVKGVARLFFLCGAGRDLAGSRGEWVEVGDEKRDTMPEGKGVRDRKIGGWRSRGKSVG